MNLLLDTCSVLHLAFTPEKLSAEAHSAISDLDNVIYVSAITAGEIACLVMRNRIRLPAPAGIWFRDKIQSYGWGVLPLRLDTFEEAYSLPDTFHNDPCDRIIVATARLNNLTVVTTDKLILDYTHVASMK